MGNRLKIEKILWRGPWLLVIIPEEARELFKESFLKIYWGDQCRAAGKARTLDPQPSADGYGITLDIAEVCRGKNDIRPTKMEIQIGNETLDLPIETNGPESDKKKVPEPRYFLMQVQQKGLC